MDNNNNIVNKKKKNNNNNMINNKNNKNNNEIINNLNSKISAISNTISLCKKCQLISKRKLGRSCCNCSHYYHFSCVTPKLTKRISSQLKNWFCSWCLKTKSQLPLNADHVATPVNDISIKSAFFMEVC